MRAIGSLMRRGLLCTTLSVAALAVVGVASASATITKTAITSPSSPWIYQFNANASPVPQVTISGTSDGTTGDKVDVICVYSSGGSVSDRMIDNNAGNGIAVNADGTWTTGPITVDQEGYTCQLRAVPHGHGDSYPLDPFAGVYSELDYLTQYPVTGSAAGSTGPFYDFYYTATSNPVYDDYFSVGDCGLDYSSPLVNGYDYTNQGTWACAGALYGGDGGNRSEILIDGKNAYDSYAADSAYSDGGLGETSGQAAGFPALSSSYSKDPKTDDVTISESEGLVSCADASYPATEAKCGGTAGSNIGAWQSDGVSFSRTINQTMGGQLVQISDTYKSTDGKAHSLDLEYDNAVQEADDGPTFEFSGSSSWASYAEGDHPPLSSNSEDVVYVANYDNPNGSLNAGPGALIYTTQPNGAEFNDTSNSPAQEFVLDYQRSVPAGGSITITHYYVTAADLATTEQIANSVLDQTYKPAVSITSPANDTVTSLPWATISGTASAHDGLALKVNGQTVPVNADGTWATTIGLKPGLNGVTAVASDGSGNTAQAAELLAYEPPTVPNPAASFCIVPNVSHMTLAKAKNALVAAHCGVGHISHTKSRTVRKGRVEHASYGTNVVLAYGSRVGLTVSSGKPHKKHHKKHKKHVVRHAHRR